MNHNSIDVKLMRQIFYYEPELGQLFYRYDTDKRCKGDRAGIIGTRGYRIINIKDATCLEHRIIYAVVTGRDPGDLHVHHINGVKDHNDFYNLMALTPAEHALEHKEIKLLNRRKKVKYTELHPFDRPLSKRNISGINGVDWDDWRQRWVIRVNIGGRLRRLGRYKDLETVRAKICKAWDEYQASLFVD